jgi:hypothetical protein
MKLTNLSLTKVKLIIDFHAMICLFSPAGHVYRITPTCTWCWSLCPVEKCFHIYDVLDGSGWLVIFYSSFIYSELCVCVCVCVIF